MTYEDWLLLDALFQLCLPVMVLGLTVAFLIATIRHSGED